jgi:cobalt-zinc-cadmium efflux system membrane fusion protein
MRRTTKIKTTLAFIVIFSFSCSENVSNRASKPVEEPISPSFLQNIQTPKAKLSNQEEELTLTGKVAFDPDKTIHYVPLISGVVDRVYFSLGDNVQKGQPLLDIRSTDLSALQSEYISLETEEKTAQRGLKSAQAMYHDNMLPEIELIEAQGKLRQVQAALNKIKADIAVFGVSKGNGSFSIKAPMKGHIVHRRVSSGTTISADSEPLFSISDLGTVWINANIYASSLLFVREGMDAEITTLSYPGKIFHGKINSLSQVFDPEEKVLKARIIMPNTDLKFKPEMSVAVKLKNETNKQFISIPSDALIFDKNRYFVVAMKSSKDFLIKEVFLEGHHKETSYLSEGLSEGEEIVIKNQLLIYSELNKN